MDPATIRPASLPSVNSSVLAQYSTPKEEIQRKPGIDRPLSASAIRSASSSPVPKHNGHSGTSAMNVEVPPFHPNLMINLSATDHHNGHYIQVNRSPSLDALRSSSSFSSAFASSSSVTPQFAAINAINHSAGEYCCQCVCHSMDNLPRHPTVAALARPLPPIPPTALSPAHLPGSAPWVFLGGSCDPTTWRKDVAVPKLEKFQIPYYNPQIDDWTPEMIAREAKAKEDCEVLLFVIDSKTRAIASMLEATEYIMSNRKVILVILDIPAGCKIDGEAVGERQLKDLNRARAFLCDIAARHQQRCDVFDSVEMAINHIIYSHPSQMKSPRKSQPSNAYERTPTLLAPSTPTAQPNPMAALSLASLSSLSSLSTPTTILHNHSLSTPTHVVAASPLQHAAQLLSAATHSPSHALSASHSASSLNPLSSPLSAVKNTPPVRPSSASAIHTASSMHGFNSSLSHVTNTSH